MNTQQIKFDQVIRSYNGKSGCMCGCQGTYKTPSHAPNDRDTVSDRSVQIAVNKINKALIDDPNSVDYEEGHYYGIDDGNRTTAIYLK